MKKKMRKTMEEVRLEERTRGFYDCLVIFEELWRKRVWQVGPHPNLIERDTPCTILWDGIEKAQAKIKYDEYRYKKLSLGRRGYDIDTGEAIKDEKA